VAALVVLTRLVRLNRSPSGGAEYRRHVQEQDAHGRGPVRIAEPIGALSLPTELKLFLG
jgi:hypothetical protein